MAIRRPVNKVERAMSEMEQGLLHSGSKAGPRVTNPKQAVAIGIHEQQQLSGMPGGSMMPVRRKPALSPFG